MPRRSPIRDARELRRQQTEAESLLWSVVRGRQVCHLKFRRQHPEPPFILDFACVSAMLGVELDGSYHEGQLSKDTEREAFLRRKGWDIIRFTNEDVLADPECVAIAIARHLSLQYEFKKRSGGLSSITDRHRLDREEKQRSRE
ncbi:endonuclease domain-containing protein [Rhodopirellula bahusiensis]|uniref:endonuclease domain-containing protein n=1 Tax=Rhodopirellula bahusiensis TaxID=2014065 RepID=UPI0032646AF1